ncbi:hypothetical protein pdam_00001486, partial [Pocillopora damicornis]
MTVLITEKLRNPWILEQLCEKLAGLQSLTRSKRYKPPFCQQGKISRSLSVNGGVSLGGECRWSRDSCYKTADTVREEKIHMEASNQSENRTPRHCNSVTLRKDWSSPDPQLEAGAFVRITVTPKISVKLPASPKSQSKAIKSSFFSFFDDLGEVNQTIL